MPYALTFAMTMAFLYMVLFFFWMGSKLGGTDTTNESTLGSALAKVMWIAFYAAKNWVYLYVVLGCFVLTRLVWRHRVKP